MTTERRLRLWIAASVILIACGGFSNAFADDADATKAASKLVGAHRVAASIDIPIRPSTTAATARHRRRIALRARRFKPAAAIRVAYRSMPETACYYGWCRAPVLLILGIGY
jgi:hypothetical protein